jgi:prepilin-type N-terminal cleavage/methylation domain-containing protein
MRIADCGLRNRRQTTLGRRQPAVNSAIRNPQSAFTLIELLVAVGLMAILLTMIAVIFLAATQGFRAARASIEVHESARSALNALLNDLTAAEFTAYDNGVQGYFALSAGPADPTLGSCPAAWSPAVSYAANEGVVWNGNSYLCLLANIGQQPPNANWQLLGPWILPRAANGNLITVDTLTFTTLAAQPGARFAAATESIEQLALVRYALEWDGGSATFAGTSTPRPTYNLVKRVRFPCTSDPNLNMDQFCWPLLPVEYAYNANNAVDATGLRYAQSEVIAFHVLSMNIRLFCLPQKSSSETSEAFVEAGFATGNPPAGNPASLTDTTKNWPLPLPASFTGQDLRIYAGTGSNPSQWGVIGTINPANTINLSPGPPVGTGYLNGANWYTTPDTTSQYRVDGLLASLFPSNPAPPGWYQRVSAGGNFNFFGPTYRPPAVVEVTLEMTDVRATHAFTFTQRFYIPASERPPHN